MYHKTLVTLCVVVSICALVQSLSVKIEPRSEQCFFEPVQKVNTMVMLQFQVSYGGFLDIDVVISSPSGEILHNSQRETEGKLSFMASTEGEYKICFRYQTFQS
jgi:hypothetical protein